MSYINITNVLVHNNPSTLNTNILFEVTFECLQQVTGILDWKVMYIGAKKDQSGDQTLANFEMGPISPGVMKFNIQTNAPNYELIPAQSLLDVTALLISVNYKNQEFFRLGYYVHHQYVDQELKQNPPEQILYDKLQRVIIADKPIITKPQIDWQQQQEIPMVPCGEIGQVSDPFAEMSGVLNQLPNVSDTGNWSYGQDTQKAWGTTV